MPTLICVTPELEKIKFNTKSFNESCSPYDDDNDDNGYPGSAGESSDTCWPD